MNLSRAKIQAISAAALTYAAWSVDALAQEAPSPTVDSPPAPLPASKPDDAAVPHDAPSPPAASSPAPSPPAASPPEPSKAPAPPPPPESSQVEITIGKAKLDISGGASFYYYQPFLPESKGEFKLFYANLALDASLENWGLYMNFCVGETPPFPYYESNAWFQEIYAFYRSEQVTVKAGKLFSRFGLVWDGSSYGNIHLVDGLKIDPDNGLSVEGSVGQGPGLRLGYVAQYFLMNGGTNFSIPGRDTISVPGAHQRHSVILRAEPAFYFKDDVSLTLGLSGQYFQADLAEAGKENVFRAGADLTYTHGPFSVFGEYTRQNGKSITDYPIAGQPATDTQPATPGRASAHNDYVLAGTSLTVWKLTPRYTLTLVRYGDEDVVEWMSNVGVGVEVYKNLVLTPEYVYWKRSDPGSSTVIDHSLSIYMWSHF